eukprot:9493788-Pyramimonas_sp.AAC.1
MKVPGRKFQDLLCSSALGAAPGEDENEAAAGEAAKPASDQFQNRKLRRPAAPGIGTRNACTTDAGDRGSPGNMRENEYKDHLDALTLQTRDTDRFEDPFNEKRCRNAMFNPSKDERSIDDALNAIMSGTKRPNRERLDFLEHFTKRLKIERSEQVSDRVNDSSGEPLLDLVHGFPGTGKSAAIAWARQIMEESGGSKRPQPQREHSLGDILDLPWASHDVTTA